MRDILNPDMRTLYGYVCLDEWPAVHCPSCRTGTLRHSEQNSLLMQTGESARNQKRNRDRDPLELFAGVAAAALRCDGQNCSAVVIAVGTASIDYDVDSDGNTVPSTYLQIRYIEPPLPLLRLDNEAVPRIVLRELERASRLIWSDPTAAANALRAAVERLLDAQRVRKLRADRRRLPTHQRIDRLAMRRPSAAARLEAVKWIGNDGSHGRPVTHEEVLTAAELLGACLHDIYDRSESRLARTAKEINQRRGVSSRRRR